MAKAKTGVILKIYVYSDHENGKHNEWGNVFAPWIKDPGGIPYGDPLKGMEVIARELRRAHREAAALRKGSKQKPEGSV